MSTNSKLPPYMQGAHAREAMSGAKKTGHPDYLNMEKDTKYWVVLLPGHPNHPKYPYKDKKLPYPYVNVYKYFQYKMPPQDPRNTPITTPKLMESGADPLYRRHLRLMESEEKEERSRGWALRPKVYVVVNVLVLQTKDKNGNVRSGPALGEIAKRPHIMAIPSDTWTKEVLPLFADDDYDGDEGVSYDLFGVTTKTVPVLTVEHVSKGKEVYEFDWRFTRKTQKFELTKELRASVIDLTAHETLRPHTAEELKTIMNLTSQGAAEAANTSSVNYPEAEDEDTISDEEEVVSLPDDEEDVEEEEDKPKKRAKPAKAAKEFDSEESSPKKKKSKKVSAAEEAPDEDEFDLDFDDEDDDDDSELNLDE